MLAATAMNVNAQLVVDSLGRVGIGTETPTYKLSIKGIEDDDCAMSCKATENFIGISVSNVTHEDCVIYGGQLHARNTIGYGYGAIGTAVGGGSSGRSTGLAGYATRSTTSIGLLGGKYMGAYTPTNFAGVYGSETGMDPSFSNFSGLYAGYFYGKVRVTNGIYATLLSPSACASPSGQNGTTILSDRGESVTDKLSQVQTLQFLRYNPTEETGTRKSIPTDSEIDKTICPPGS